IGKYCRSYSEAFAKNRIIDPLSPLSAGRAGSDAEAEAAESLTPGTLVSWDGRRAGDEQPAKASRSGSATTGLQPFNTRSLCGSRALTQVRFAILTPNGTPNRRGVQSGLAQRSSPRHIAPVILPP